MFVIISDKQKAISRASTNLCLSCHHYFAVVYSLTDQEQRRCTYEYNAPLYLRGPVSKCTGFSDKTRPARGEMDKMAWAIEPNKGRAGFKFVPPSERKDIDK